MAKYKYKRDVFKGLTPFPFLGEVKTRVKNIEAASTEFPKSVFNPNTLAAKLHPHYQSAKVAKVEEQPDAKVYTLVADEAKGTKSLAYFRAGQYISVVIDIDGAKVTKPYTLAGSPKAALGDENTSYTIMIKKAAKGYASEYILNNWKEGTEIVISGPLGHYYYQGLRDAKKVIAAAGGSGITPFISMARAIVDGEENFDLTILFGSKTEKDIAFKKELDEIVAASNGKVQVVHILSDEQKEGYESGFITAELIKKYAGEEDYSIFVCGNQNFYKFMHGEVEKLGLPGRRVRFEVPGEMGDPTQDEAYNGDVNAEYNITVVIRGEETEIKCQGGETLLHAIQAAGIMVTSDCRSGLCGWCHSRLIMGEVFIPEDHDGRRLADKKFGWIHPCATYPMSDIKMEVFPIM
ncbi:MAG: iron-sulfur cluster-binding domain-containing protein [Mogibacterium sp.]|nr:iron-sulfur cluster-binding domain-containing protein [Mogibacterium sp.]